MRLVALDQATAMNSLADLEFQVAVWDDHDLHLDENLAASVNLLVARAAFDEALTPWLQRIELTLVRFLLGAE